MKNYSSDDLKSIIDKLVSEDGCPWDKIQTHQSLKPYLIEESYEVLDAIDLNDNKGLCEELGDVLLQVYLHSAIAEKNGEFTFSDVVNVISEKMIRRHPHIFSSAEAETPDDVLKNWDEIKKEEKGYTSGIDIINRIPKSLPALMYAQKVQSKTSKMGFENKTPEELIEEMQKSINALKECNSMSEMSKMSEIGDFLSNIIKFSQFFKINTEIALTNATKKFINRFEGFEKQNNMNEVHKI